MHNNKKDQLFSVGLPLCAICHQRPLSLELTSTRMMRGHCQGNLRPANFLLRSNNVSLLRAFFFGLCSVRRLFVLSLLYVLWAVHCDIHYSTVLYCTVQYNTVLYCTVLYRTVQYSTVQHNTVQYSTVQYSTVLYCTVQYSTIQYSTGQYSTVQYSTVQYSTVQYSTLQYSTV